MARRSATNVGLSEERSMRKLWDYSFFIGQLSLTALAVTGMLFNNAQSLWCFPIWIVANLINIYYHAITKLYGLIIKDILFTLLAFVGWWQWSNVV
jgi:nicotinamide riboside transporter PnuC